MPELRGRFRAGGSVEGGREIVSKVGCLGCHRIAGIEPKGQPSEAPSAVSPVNSGAQALDSEQGAAVAVNGEQASQPVRARLTAPPPTPENQDFAPDLSKIAGKVNAEWLFSWVKNPKHFGPTTRMPSLRLSDDEARAVTAFLMTLGQRRPIAGLDQEGKKTERIAAGGGRVQKGGGGGWADAQ